MNGDHPIAWCQTYEGGRSFYTGGGHTKESYAEPAFRQHLLGGCATRRARSQADCRPETGYRPLFDGRTLDGWKQAGPGQFTRRRRRRSTEGGMGMLWYQAKELKSYSLKLDWKLAGDDNSGVFVGFPASDDPWSAVNNGYEVQIDATDAPGAHHRLRLRLPVGRPRGPRPRRCSRPGEWNSYEIRVQGERLQVFLNGVKINDFTNTDPARSLKDGHIGLQNHGADDQVSFRDIRLRELEPHRPERRSPGTPGREARAEAHPSEDRAPQPSGKRRTTDRSRRSVPPVSGGPRGCRAPGRRRVRTTPTSPPPPDNVAPPRARARRTARGPRRAAFPARPQPPYRRAPSTRRRPP